MHKKEVIREDRKITIVKELQELKVEKNTIQINQKRMQIKEGVIEKEAITRINRIEL